MIQTVSFVVPVVDQVDGKVHIGCSRITGLSALHSVSAHFWRLNNCVIYP